MQRTRTVSSRRASRALRISTLVALLVPAFGFATDAHAGAPDTLSVQVVPVDDAARDYLVGSIAERSLGTETLFDRVSQVAGGALSKVEATCRTELMPKYMEPGSPWLGWRMLARVRRDSCDWFIGALSCADSLCGGSLVTHERIAFMSVTPARAQILVYPGRASTIADPGSCIVDSIALHKGTSHVVVQARRREDSEHPCYDGPSQSSSVTADFFVLRGDRVLQAFSLQTAAETSDHDDVDGDSGSTTTATVVVSATSIQLDGRTDEWQETPDGDPKKTQHRLRQGRVRLRYSDGSGKYMTASQ